MAKQIHRLKTPWNDDHSVAWDHHILRAGEITGVGFGADLTVSLVAQYRHFYPPGEGPGCCTEKRTVLRVRGPITSARDLRLVQAKLAELAAKVVPAERTPSSKHRMRR